ncbi:MAG: GNAT family N-acetyltransferase [Acidimicrobiia bacterium]
MTDLAACDRNLAEATARTVGAYGRVERDRGLTMGASGFPAAFFNAGVATGPSADPGALLDRLGAFFGELPHQLWLRDGLDGGLIDAALRRGLVVSGGPPLLVLDELPTDPSMPAELAVAVVTEADRAEVTTMSAIGNGMPPHFAGTYLPADVLAGADDAAVVVGRVDGEAVTTAMVVVTDGAAGIYAVSTVPEHRGKGYGAAITWAAVEEGRRRGATWSVLQASSMGLPVYERMGYRVVGQYSFIGPRPP